MHTTKHWALEPSGYRQLSAGAWPCERLNSLYIEGDDITNLEGLSEIVELAWSLQIVNNPLLNDISGLSALTRVGTLLLIQRNPAMSNLDGLAALTEIGEALESGGAERDVQVLADGSGQFRVRRAREDQHLVIVHCLGGPPEPSRYGLSQMEIRNPNYSHPAA